MPPPRHQPIWPSHATGHVVYWRGLTITAAALDVVAQLQPAERAELAAKIRAVVDA